MMRHRERKTGTIHIWRVGRENNKNKTNTTTEYMGVYKTNLSKESKSLKQTRNWQYGQYF